MSRRTTLAFVAALVLVLAVSITPTFARLAWCSTDPIMTLPDGREVSVLVEAPIEFIGSTVQVNINAPRGTTMDSILPGDLVLDVKYRDNKPLNDMHLVVAPTGNFPVRVTVTLDGVVIAQEEGTAGQALPIRLQF